MMDKQLEGLDQCRAQQQVQGPQMENLEAPDFIPIPPDQDYLDQQVLRKAARKAARQEKTQERSSGTQGE